MDVLRRFSSVLENKRLNPMPVSIGKFSTWTKCKSVHQPIVFWGHTFFFAWPYMCTFAAEINRKSVAYSTVLYSGFFLSSNCETFCYLQGWTKYDILTHRLILGEFVILFTAVFAPSYQFHLLFVLSSAAKKNQVIYSANQASED